MFNFEISFSNSLKINASEDTLPWLKFKAVGQPVIRERGNWQCFEPHSPRIIYELNLLSKSFIIVALIL